MRTLLAAVTLAAFSIGAAGVADAQKFGVDHGPKTGVTEKCRTVGPKGAKRRVCKVGNTIPPYRLDAKGVCRDAVGTAVDIRVCTDPKANKPLPVKPQKPLKAPKPKLGRKLK